MTAESPVKSALDNIIEIFDIQDKIKCFSYKSNESFNGLWNFENFKTVGVEKVIIVWDGIPQRTATDPVNTGKYLTPVDWAAAFSLSIYNNNPEAPSYPNLKIIILDISSEETSALKAGRALMPWVRVVRQGKEDIISILFDIEQKNVRDSFTESGSDKPDMVALKNFWASMLTRPSDPGDHHALANLIGPLLLMDDAVVGKGDPQIKALRTLMEAIGLLPARSKENEDLSKNKWIDWNAYKLDELVTGYNNISFILVDDMWQSGWGRILCHAVGSIYYEKTAVQGEGFATIGNSKDGKIIVKATASADLILNQLEKFIKQGKKDSRFEFSFGGSDKSLEILFLDLRLFAGKNSESERKFFERTMKLAENFAVGESKENKLPWRGFSKAEIDSVRRWIENKDKKAKIEDTDYILALTFLPRIIALMDLSIPIVLFSSTGRRDIVEQFKDYGNIITDFDKPKFTVDIPVDIAKSTKGKFQTAIEASLAMLGGRKKCKMIYGLKPDQAQGSTEQKKHIELFIDEAHPFIKKGDRYVADETRIFVGGCFAIFSGETNDKAKIKADAFDDDLVKEGVRYFDSLGIGAQSQQIKKKKNKAADKLLKVMTNSANFNLPEKLGFIRLLHALNGQEKKFDLFNPNSADNRYRLTMVALIEHFLSESLPALLGSKGAEDASISIFVGTRVKVFENDPAGNELNKAIYHSGMESSANRLYSISRDSIYPIVSDILSFHNIKRNIERVAGVKLCYATSYARPNEFPEYFICRKCKKIIHIKRNKSENEALKCSCAQGEAKLSPDYRALHYIADEVLDHADEVKSGKGYGMSIKRVDGGFDDEFNDDFKHLIKASRFLDQGDIIDSLVEVKINDSMDPNQYKTQYKAKPLLLHRIAARLGKLNGADFCRLAIRLVNETARSKLESASHKISSSNVLPATGISKKVQEGMQSNTRSSDRKITERKEHIKVIRLELKGRSPRFICNGKDDREIIITRSEAMQARSRNTGISISIGVTLKAIVFSQNGKFFAKEIESLS